MSRAETKAWRKEVKEGETEIQEQAKKLRETGRGASIVFSVSIVLQSRYLVLQWTDPCTNRSNYSVS